MRKLGLDIQDTIAEIGGQSRTSRFNRRVVQVRERYRQAIESVYSQNADLFLQHTNNVYILDKDGVRTLIVYVDESIFAAELNAQRELIKLKLLELFGEAVESFEIHVSKGNYKDNHPYAVEIPVETANNSRSIPLDDAEKSRISQTAARIEDERLRKTFEKAMTADFKRIKSESEEISS